MKKTKSKKTRVPPSPETKLRHWLINKLRRISYQWPERKEAIKKARIARGKYKCSSCEGTFGPKQIQLDHILPVVDPHVGFHDWNSYIDRLFCGTAGFQVLCKPCHSAKSFFENNIRNQIDRQKTQPDDDDI